MSKEECPCNEIPCPCGEPSGCKNDCEACDGINNIGKLKDSVEALVNEVIIKDDIHDDLEIENLKDDILSIIDEMKKDFPLFVKGNFDDFEVLQWYRKWFGE